ncbi:hypothetical protein D3227_39735 [Mesorhizobium waimense]|uniref:Uncharacterized protein n=1 Tax=Mesorhizobium waimense TaxID=1300307 RepID=A0A3A5JQE3_9HYPH|nr:hypothetical protein D3227_39735 [Mesorhizobium waimense]
MMMQSQIRCPSPPHLEPCQRAFWLPLSYAVEASGALWRHRLRDMIGMAACLAALGAPHPFFRLGRVNQAFNLK